MTYDGTILIDTKIDESGFASGLEHLESLASKAMAGIAELLGLTDLALQSTGAQALEMGSLFGAAFGAINQQTDMTGAVANIAEARAALENFAHTAESAGEMEQSGAGLVQRLLDGVLGALPALQDAGPGMMQDILAGMEKSAGSLDNAADEVVGRLADGLGAARGKLGIAADEMMGSVLEGIQDNNASVALAGQNIVQGIWEGISSMGHWLSGQVNGFLGGIVDGIKGFLGIASPSKLFRDEIGKMLPPGIVLGFEAAMPRAAQNMDAQLEDFVHSAREVALSTTGAPLPASQAAPAAVYGAANNYYYSQEIHTAQALSPYELTREFENMKAKEGWAIP